MRKKVMEGSKNKKKRSVSYIYQKFESVENTHHIVRGHAYLGDGEVGKYQPFPRLNSNFCTFVAPGIVVVRDSVGHAILGEEHLHVLTDKH